MCGFVRRRCALVLLQASCLALRGPGLVAEDEKSTAPRAGHRVYIEDAHTATAVGWAVAGAARRLEVTRCQGLFSLPALRARDGHLLQQRLAELSVDGVGYLSLLLFVDGTDSRPCRQGALAFTSPGSRVIRVCGHGFVREWKQRPRRAQLLLIHEALHTLGLGENPPSSEEISNIVLTHCGETG